MRVEVPGFSMVSEEEELDCNKVNSQVDSNTQELAVYCAWSRACCESLADPLPQPHHVKLGGEWEVWRGMGGKQ